MELFVPEMVRIPSRYLLLDANGELQNDFDKPLHWKKYTNIAASLKGYKSGKHIIFYRQYEENSVEIIRILHEQMDLNARIIEK